MDGSVKGEMAKYVESNLRAIKVLYSEKLFGQLLIVLYSSIDCMGLLDAEPHVDRATGDTFKAWATKYIFVDSRFRFNVEDLWSARCAILHTFTTISDYSRKGRARQIQYFSSDDRDRYEAFADITDQIDGGKHVAFSFEAFLDRFVDALVKFKADLEEKCIADQAYKLRLKEVVGMYKA